MHFDFLFPGKTKEAYCIKGIDEFFKRLKHFVKADIRIIKEKKCVIPIPESKEHKETCSAFLTSVRKPSFVVMLDRRGGQVSSEELSQLITKWEDEGRNHITFMIGGPLGFSEDVLPQADFVMSLSKLTFPHDLARLILLEQLYRAFTIKSGTGYHK
jgi:23S rRNA (pseudouridine1915-N3)-methyltransferase